MLPQKAAELPQHNSMFSGISPDEIALRACEVLDLEIEAVRQARRMLSTEKEKRDLIIYLPRDIGGFSNREIGSVFNLTYSSESRRMSETGSRLKTEKNLYNQYNALKSEIKGDPGF